MDFFNEIKRLCKANGITIDALMQKIGKSGIHVYAGWKQRNCIPRGEDLYNICKVLNVPMEHFFATENITEYKNDSIQHKLSLLSPEEIEILNNLSLEQLKSLIKLVSPSQS